VGVCAWVGNQLRKNMTKYKKYRILILLYQIYVT
jgi:hypothetical protein